MANIEKIYEPFEDQSGKRSEIGKFLSGKNVFITGGTGFCGQSLIERLLSATPEIGKIYILIRAKNGYSPEDRVARLMAKSVSKFDDQLNNFYVGCFIILSNFINAC